MIVRWKLADPLKLSTTLATEASMPSVRGMPVIRDRRVIDPASNGGAVQQDRVLIAKDLDPGRG